MASAAGEQGELRALVPNGSRQPRELRPSRRTGCWERRLLWSRLFGLGHSFWNDEILMVDGYVRRGPRFILTGPAINHELMALLSWDRVVRRRRVRGRAAPPLGRCRFVAGRGARHGLAARATWRAVGRPVPLPRDRLATAPRHHTSGPRLRARLPGDERRGRRRARGPPDRTRMARRRRCASAAFSERGRCRRLPSHSCPRRPSFCSIGGIRLAAAAGLALAVAAIVGWYAPHSGAVQGSAAIPDGVQIGFPWVVTAPIDQVLLPALIWIDGTALEAGPIWLPAVALAAIVAAASPLLREWRSAVVLCAAPS